jgi:DNA-binding MurR/RpiR family transcriptional regulator
MNVVERIMEHAERLTATERKIAEVVATEPQTIAFGTVAQVAKRAGTSGPSVIRLAVKLGYGGFVNLQADVQQELAGQLAPAHDRIRQSPPTDLLSRVRAVEHDNVAHTLDVAQAATLDRTVALVCERRQIWVLPGEMTLPVGMILATQLTQLRAGVELVTGSEAAVSRGLAGLEPDDVVIGIDIRRYERSLVALLRWTATRGATNIAITDSPLSPLAASAAETFLIAAQGVGPFDSMTGGLALSNLIVASAAARLRASATKRLDAVEAAWTATDALVADAPISPSGEPGSSSAAPAPPG